MEVGIIWFLKSGCYTALNLKPTVFMFLAKMWLFLGFGMLKPDDLD